ncbi:MAG: AAA family ATPase [Deltaproteobacteria bacterium]|jgi:BioD-like phosphotransacetylase family protein|nr:AAA family ATPase [Deltaproteobacteria bacterium]
MPGLYIASTRPKTGKTLCACAMGVLMQRQGLSVGYIKPVGGELKLVEAGKGDAGALVVQEVLGQDALPEDLTTVMRHSAWGQLGSCPLRGEEALGRIKKSYAGIAKGKDWTLVNGSGSFPAAGQFAGVDGLTLVQALDLRVILVETLEDGLDFDAVLLLRKHLGKRLAGVILNKAPTSEIPLCRQWLAPYLESYGVKVLGIIPNEPELKVIRCMNLAYELGGRIVAGNSSAAKLGIAGFLIGSMQIDGFMTRVRDKTASAIIVGGDRTDLQLAALCAKGNCLVLTGNISPDELVRTRAEKLDIPIIVATEDTYTMARRIARILEDRKFDDMSQINRGIRLFDESIELEALLAYLGNGKAPRRHPDSPAPRPAPSAKKA